MKTPDYRSVSILRKLGIAPELMIPIILIDFLLFSGEFFSVSTSLVISIPVGFLIGIFSMIWQRRKYRDTLPRAVGKGILLGVLTAIPTPAASIFTFLAGLLPLFDQHKEEIAEAIEKDKEREMRETSGKVIDQDKDLPGREQ